jgi:hypothetical protein
MTKRLAMMLCFVAAGASANAQEHVISTTGSEPYHLASPVKNLATLFHDLFGPGGLRVDSEATLPGEQPHTAHFNSNFQFNFSQFNTALVNQLVTVPLPSPASGFTYEFDPSVGVFRRTTQSFGPILTERAETIGSHRVSFGFASQRFTFDTVEGIDLGAIPAVFTHDNAQLLGGRQDVVTTMNSIEANVSQFVSYVTVGVTDHLDVSLAIPAVSTSLSVTSDATIQRLGTTNPLTHFYRQSDGTIGTRRLFTATDSASGIGDLVVRLKSSILRKASTGVAAGLDVRVPSGDALNLLGTGAPGLQPFLVVSGTVQRVSPHLNVGYQWNGSSVLSGDPTTGQASDFPDQVAYAAGADLSAGRLTVVFDVLGRYLLKAERLNYEDFHALDGKSVFPNVTFTTESFNVLNGSLGFKINALGRLLVDVNILFALDDNGVRDKVTPLIGFEYSF